MISKIAASLTENIWLWSLVSAVFGAIGAVLFQAFSPYLKFRLQILVPKLRQDIYSRENMRQLEVISKYCQEKFRPEISEILSLPPRDFRNCLSQYRAEKDTRTIGNNFNHYPPVMADNMDQAEMTKVMLLHQQQRELEQTSIYRRLLSSDQIPERTKAHIERLQATSVEYIDCLAEAFSLGVEGGSLQPVIHSAEKTRLLGLQTKELEALTRRLEK